MIWECDKSNFSFMQCLSEDILSSVTNISAFALFRKKDRIIIVWERVVGCQISLSSIVSIDENSMVQRTQNLYEQERSNSCFISPDVSEVENISTYPPWVIRNSLSWLFLPLDESLCQFWDSNDLLEGDKVLSVDLERFGIDEKTPDNRWVTWAPDACSRTI